MATNQIVVFKLGAQEYGIDIMRVIEISDYKTVTQVPEVPDYIEGIINIRGDIYPIYNLRKRFRMNDQGIDENTKMIQMNLGEIKVAFVVDNVCEILTVKEEEVEATPKMISRYESKYITGVSKHGERIILLLDIDLLVSDKDQEILGELV
ncbi:MAG: chemotaxis protein CheW [Cellulosilyticaceae bacterium]